MQDGGYDVFFVVVVVAIAVVVTIIVAAPLGSSRVVDGLARLSTC